MKKKSMLAADRMTRRQQLSLPLSAAAAALFGACRSAAQPAGKAPPAGQAGACRSKLEWWGVLGVGGVRWNAFQEITRAFAERRPGCSVEMVDVPTGLNDKVIAAMAAGSPPALMNLPPGSVAGLAHRGVLANVDDLFKRDKLSGADFSPGMWLMMSYGGKVWIMPQEVNADFPLHWNKAHFREAGLDSEKPPASLTELDALIPRLTREQGGEYERVGMVTWDLSGTSNTLAAWAYACGGSFFDRDKDEFTFNHPRIIRSVEWYGGWAQRLGVARVTGLIQKVQVQGVHYFGSGRFSIHALTSVTLRGVLQNDPTLEIGAGPFPAESPGKVGSAKVGGWAIGAVNGSPQREQAWDFMRFVGASEEGTTMVARLTGIPGWLKSPGLRELEQDPLQRPYVDAMRRAEFPALSFYGSVVDLGLGLLNQAINGQLSIREALERINQEVNARYLEWKRQEPGRQLFKL